MEVKFTVNIEEVDVALKKLENKLAKKILRQVCRDATKLLMERTKDLIPVNTGNARDCLIVRKGSNKRGEISYRVFTDLDKLEIDKHKSANFRGYYFA